jgi:hypothetical protein
MNSEHERPSHVVIIPANYYLKLLQSIYHGLELLHSNLFINVL